MSVRTFFSNVAGRYDAMNRVMSLRRDLRWRRNVAAWLACNPPPARNRIAILDLACGTGDFADALRRHFPNAQILGLDFTPEMLAIAKRKFPAEEFVAGDAMRMPFSDGWFDLVVCGFGFRNFPDKRKALSECRRVLKADGRLAVLELFRPQSRLLGAAVRVWLGFIAFLFAGSRQDEYRYLRSSISHTVDPDGFIALANESGFSLSHRRTFLPSATFLAFNCADSSEPDEARSQISKMKGKKKDGR